MALERVINDLLYAHDCVIVPGFGGFLTHYRSARLDVRQRLLHPPGKDLSFNRNLLRSDGLLADELARREGLGHEPAKQRITQVVDGWRGRLERDGRLELPLLGTFFLDTERNLQFDPDRHVNHLKDAYGLRPVPAVPVMRRAAEPAPVVRTLVPAAAEGNGTRRPAIAWAAAAISAIVFAGGAYVLMRSGMTGAQWSGLGPFGPQEPLAYVPRELPTAPVEPADAPLLLPDTGHGVVRIALPGEDTLALLVYLGAPPAPTAAPDSTAVAVRTESYRFHVIGGCFSVQENAEGYMSLLRAKGFSPVLVDRKGGLYRVALGSYPDRGMALEALAAARGGEAPEAWLLVK